MDRIVVGGGASCFGRFVVGGRTSYFGRIVGSGRTGVGTGAWRGEGLPSW